MRRLCLAAVLLSPLLAGCASFYDLFGPADFDALPAAAAPAAPAALAPGDRFTYRRAGQLVVEEVAAVDGPRIVWAASDGRRWTTRADIVMPPQAEVGPDDKPVTTIVYDRANEVFPIAVGKVADYRYTHRMADGTLPQRRHQRCSVDDYGLVGTEAGSFEAFKLNCLTNGEERVVYFAPAVGREVAVVDRVLFGSLESELVAYERGTHAPKGAPKDTPKDTQMVARPAPVAAAPVAAAAQATAAPAIAAGPARPVRKPAAAPDAGGTATAGRGRFGLQLAAYRSPDRARQAWDRLRQRAGAALDDLDPVVERHQDGSGIVLYRLVGRGFATKDSAQLRCRDLQRAGVDCWARELASL